MRKSTRRVLPLLLALGVHLPGWADEYDHDRAWRLHHSGEIRPLEEILSRARALHDGRVIDIEMEEKEGVIVYEIEIVDNNGVVWELYFDARQGTLITNQEDH